MPITAAAAEPPFYSRTAAPGAAADLRGTEWLLADGQGGFAMGSVPGVPTRRYHAWLIAATTPPVGRVVTLHSCVETLVENPGEPGERSHDLSTFAFRGGTLHPSGVHALRRFEAGAACTWEYELGQLSTHAPARDESAPFRVTRTLCLARPRAGEGHGPLAACAVRYHVAAPGRRVALHLRPLVALRDFHGLLRGRGCLNRFAASTLPGVVSVETSRGYAPEGLRLNLVCAHTRFVGEEQWWFDFDYAADADRGQDHLEDLWSPGAFVFEPRDFRDSHTLEFRAWVGSPDHPPAGTAADWAGGRASRERVLVRALPGPAGGDGRDARVMAALVAAGDRFIVRRDRADGHPSVSVIAGYPWFGDWGRDTMISLPGLMLTTGRFDEARRTLEAFASMCRAGLIPNWFDDRTGQAEYNTVDASLWFVHAACRYAELSGDAGALAGPIGAACHDVISRYRRGTEHAIRMDADGLIMAGGPETQLTWMDARRDGVIFTPRFGKPVEISALWYNALRSFAEAIDRGAAGPGQSPAAREFRDLAERTGASFCEKFWNPRTGSCYDVLTPDATGFTPGGPGMQARPNQIFAASLPHSPLAPGQRASLVEFVGRRLLTPVGLRSLAPGDPGYIGRFTGTLFERDRAYHNGTVWPWLLGPFAEATMRAADFSPESCTKAKDLLLSLVSEMDSPNPGRLLGQIPEVYDGDERPDAPRQPGGCVAQAWSVAETLRVYDMAVRGGER